MTMRMSGGVLGSGLPGPTHQDYPGVGRFRPFNELCGDSRAQLKATDVQPEIQRVQ